MSRLILLSEMITCICILTSCSNLQRTNTATDYQRAEQYIRKSESQWAESGASGDTTILQKILADDFVGVDPHGGHYNKQDQIRYAADTTYKFKSNHLNDVKIRFYDNA